MDEELDEYQIIPSPESGCCFFSGSAVMATLEEFHREFAEIGRSEHCRDCPMHGGRNG